MQPIPDVLPTGDTPAVAEAVDGEKDDELARLQRLLGMAKQPDAEAEVETDDGASAESGDDAKTKKKTKKDKD